MTSRDGYSNFGYFTAIAPDVSAAEVLGLTIDTQGYDTATFYVQTNSLASAGAMAAGDAWKLGLQHGLPSAAGVSAWSLVPLSQIIHSVEGGVNSTASDGIFQMIGSGTDASAKIFGVGYRGDPDHRYVRVFMSISNAPSTLWFCATAVLGEPSDWPVNEPVDN